MEQWLSSLAVSAHVRRISQTHWHQGSDCHRGLFPPTRYTIYGEDREPQTIEADYPSTGYQFEATEVGRCLTQGYRISPVPDGETAAIMDAPRHNSSTVGLGLSR